MKAIVLCVACLANLLLGCEGFATTLNMVPTRANRLGAMPQRRPLRAVPKAQLSPEYYNMMAAATNLLIANSEKVAEKEEEVEELLSPITDIHLYHKEVFDADLL